MMIENASQLREIYRFPIGRAEKKVLTTLEKHSDNCPTMGQMLNDQLQITDQLETREDMKKRNL